MWNDSSKIIIIVSLLIFIRIVLALWKKAPHYNLLLELSNSALIAFALIFLLVQPFLLQAYYIPTPSMEPTLMAAEGMNGAGSDHIMVNKFIYRISRPKRGDIVVFKDPRLSDETRRGKPPLIKRVIGLPGDEIIIKREQGVFVNGVLLNEPYIKEPIDYSWPFDGYHNSLETAYEVPKGHIFVLGDNRNNSGDSHLWEDPALPLENVMGRSMITFWPLRRMGRLTR